MLEDIPLFKYLTHIIKPNYQPSLAWTELSNTLQYALTGTQQLYFIHKLLYNVRSHQMKYVNKISILNLHLDTVFIILFMCMQIHTAAHYVHNANIQY